MKRNNKKGFTIVELVIVIAVIAILAGVLIPTFAGIITKAQDSAALQEATAVRNAVNAEVLYKEKVTLESKAGTKTIYVVTAADKWFKINAEGKLVPTDVVEDEATSGDFVYAKGATLPEEVEPADAVTLTATPVVDLADGAFVWIH